MKYERNLRKTLVFHILIYIAFLAIILYCVSCKSSNVVKASFDVLGKVTEVKLKELLRAESWQFAKDSVNIRVVVQRAHVHKVLGKKIAAWFTRHGQASLIKKDLHLSLEWLPKDSINVQITLKRIKYGLSTTFQ